MANRTSESHPLRIDAVVATPAGGQIGMTLCPGRNDRLSPDGAWVRDLYADLDVIRAWKPTMMITLVEEHEFALLGVREFTEVMTALSEADLLPWYHLPIRDAGVPDERFESKWASVGAAARAALRRGERIVLHCRAGLGRTGMIAARLLVELGMPPDEAIVSVRGARLGAIETRAQAEHVHTVAPLSEDAASDTGAQLRLPRDIYDRFMGALLGGAIGDALGSAFEFLSAAQIERALGEPYARDLVPAIKDSLMYPRAAGQPTDDTAMTLALVNAFFLPDPPLTMAAVHARLCELLARDASYGGMFWNGGPGGACVAMLQVAKRGAGPFQGLNADAGGNGAAMRAHVCGLFPDRAFVSEIAAAQAQLSHPHPGAIASAQVVALIAHEAFYEGRLAVDLPPEISDPTMIEAWKNAHRDLGGSSDRLPPHLLDVDMAGWNTVSAAHAISLRYVDDPEKAISFAAASGRDTDTVASMVGAMLGAVHTAKRLPTRWIAGLQRRRSVTVVAEQMLMIALDALDVHPWVIIPE